MRRKRTGPPPFDKKDLSGTYAVHIAVLAYTSGLTREQAEEIWSHVANELASEDLIRAFNYWADALGYERTRTPGWD